MPWATERNRCTSNSSSLRNRLTSSAKGKHLHSD
jgi:hypothetical protein